MKILRKWNTLKGFMLLELLTVIFIISSLVLLLIPNFRWSVYKTQLTGCQANLKNLSTALQLYANDNNDFYPDDLTKLTPNYVRDIPVCPSAQTQTYLEGYEFTPDQRSYTVYCKGTNHTVMGLEENQPSYNLSEGLKP